MLSSRISGAKNTNHGENGAIIQPDSNSQPDNEVRQDSPSKRSPIQVFQPTVDITEDDDDEESKEPIPKYIPTTGKSSTARYKTTTDADESEFNFDFDKEGSCSYVNTTEKSERNSVRRAN